MPELADELNEEEFETEDVSVKIVEISTSELAKSNNWIGENRPRYSDDDDDNDEVDNGPSTIEKSDGIPGMDLTIPAKSANKYKIKEKAETEDPSAPELKLYKSKKNLTKTIQKNSEKVLKNSKAFQIKRKLDQLKDRKKARLEREKRKKIHNKEARKNNGKLNTRKLKKKPKTKGRR